MELGWEQGCYRSCKPRKKATFYNPNSYLEFQCLFWILDWFLRLLCSFTTSQSVCLTRISNLHVPNGTLYFPPKSILSSFLHLSKWHYHSFGCSGQNTEVMHSFSPLTSNPSASPASSTFKIHPQSDHFLPPPLLGHWSQPLGVSSAPLIPAYSLLSAPQPVSILNVNQLMALSCSSSPEASLILSLKPKHLPPSLRLRPTPLHSSHSGFLAVP